MSLIAHYKLNDNAANTTVVDSTGNYNGTLVGGSDTEGLSVTGKIKKAFDFNGTDDAVNCGTTLGNFGTGNYSLIAWVYLTGNPDTNNNICAKGKNDETIDNSYVFTILTTGYLRLNTGITGSPGSRTYRTSADVVPLNQWVLLAANWNNSGNEINFYINAELSNGSYGDTNGSGVSVDNPYGFTVGADYPRDRFYFDGIIDDVRIYDTVLTQSEIQSLYGFGRTALPQMKRQHNLHTFLLGLGCTIWLPPANGTEWRSIGPVERVGVAAGGVTNNVLTSNKTSATFDGDDGLVDLGTIPANDVLQLQGAFTISVLCTPTLTGDAVQRFVDKSDGGNGANGYALVIGVSNELQMLIGGSTTARGATSLVASRQLLTYINDGIANVALYNGGTTITLASDSWRLAPNVATNMRFGSWNHSTGREFNGDMELVAIHPTRDLTQTELAHAWALAQEF